MSNTQNLDLKKMDGNPKVVNFNHKEFYENNFDKIDTAVGAKPADLTTNAKTLVPAINELKSNKVDKVTGKGLSTNDFDNTYKQKIDIDIPAQLADYATQLSKKADIKPIAVYRHNSNKEVTVSNLDITTGTFTSVGHGLINGNKIAPTVNIGTIGLPADIYPIGITNLAQPSLYYVIEASTDTFKVSLALNGIAVIPTTTGYLTKWHFETSDSPTIVIQNLPKSNYNRLLIMGKSLVNSSQNYVYPSDIGAGGYGLKGDQYAILSLLDNNFSNSELLLSGNGLYSINAVRSKPLISTGLESVSQIGYKKHGIVNLEWTSLYFYNFWPANGLIVEVYLI